MQEVIFFFDDSGTLHKKEASGYFVYAGFVFTDRNEVQKAKRKYISMNKRIKAALGRDDELKAANLQNSYRRALLNSVREYDSVGIVVDINKVYDYILNNKKSICRYKDYVLKRCVKNKLKRLIAKGEIESGKDIKISIYIDQQLTATNGYYDLRDSVKEELEYGVVNFDYGVKHQPIFEASVSVDIQYCDSSSNYMIQACDILANRIWNSYRNNDKGLRKISNNTILTFP